MICLTKIVAGLLLVALVLPVPGHTESDFWKEFEENYDRLLTDLSRKPPAELAEISDLTTLKTL